MKKLKLTQDGFHFTLLAVAIVLVGMIGFVGFKVFNQSEQASTKTSVNSAPANNEQEVTWAFNEKTNEWFAKTGKASECADPYIFDRSPVDLSKIMVIGMPGQYRGFNYKPHGGMRLINDKSGQIDIVMPTDATLVGLKRYYEGSPAELQYLLTFETDCGIAFRFDHLQTLAPDFQKIAETTPEPKLNDTRSHPNVTFARTKFKSGDLVATAVGFPSTKNFGFDVGVYDYRQRNDISKNQKWAAIHDNFTAQEWFGSCWLEQLPAADAAKAKQLGKVIINPARPNIISDYCADAPYTTLDFNNGQPTDG